MQGENITDRFGKEIKVGTQVVFCEYTRDSSLYIGIVLRFTEKNIIVEEDKFYSTRRVNKNMAKAQIIVCEQKLIK